MDFGIGDRRRLVLAVQLIDGNEYRPEMDALRAIQNNHENWQRLSTGADVDGVGLCDRDNFSHAEDVETAAIERVDVLSFSFESGGEVADGGVYLCRFCRRLDWLECTQWMGAVSRIRRESSFRELQVPDELALAQVNPVQWLSPADRERIDSGKAHLQAAASIGLFVNSETLPKLAWFAYLSGATEQSISLLTQVAPYQHGQARALSLYYRGAMLSRLGRQEEALRSFDDALAERPDLIVAREERGESLWQLDHKEQAIAVWRDALRQNPNLILARYQLAGALATLNKHVRLRKRPIS